MHVAGNNDNKESSPNKLKNGKSPVANIPIINSNMNVNYNYNLST